LFEQETAAFVEGGSALIIGTVASDGMPHAGRAWGADVLDGERLRLLLDADDTVTIDNVARGGNIAVTATSVRTFRSIQIKGRVLGLQPSTHGDGERVGRYCNAFFGDIVEMDGTARTLLERLVPSQVVVCEMAVAELFDQTPGPGAGAPIPAAGRG
jgi:hypothetical protein